MEQIKKTKEYVVYKKKSGRYAVENAKGVFLKAQEKIDVLLKEKLIKLTPKKEKAPEAPAAAPETPTA